MSNFDEEIKFLFKDKPDALRFIQLYSAHGAIIDDCVDEEKDIERIRFQTLVAGEVFNCEYWLKYRQVFYLLDRLIHNMYFDSVVWEKAEEEWKRQHAKVYSHSAMWMLLAIILIEFGEGKMREYSLKIKQYSYERHKEDKI